jgi:hypothetical protein
LIICFAANWVPKKALYCSGKEALQVLQFAHIGLDADDLDTQSSDLRFERVCRFGMRDVVDDYTCALLCELKRDGLADPTIAAGDDGNFIRE